MKTSDILKYRSAWLGFAMLWIVWCHLGIYFNFYPIAFVKNIGYGGVDICLLASGMGCYFSLRKDPSLLGFYRRRVARLFPTWLCFIVAWILWRFLSGQLPASAILGNLLGIQGWTGLGYDFNWYIGALFMFYLLSPLLKEIADAIKSTRQCILALGIMLVLTIPFWNSGSYIISITRLPVYFIGMLFGKYFSAEQDVTPKTVWCFVAMAFAGACLLFAAHRCLEAYLWSHGLYWYPFMLIAPGICVTLSFLLHSLRGNAFGRILNSILSTLGVYSFEIYLVHAMLFEIIRHMIAPLGWFADTPIIWLLSLPVIVVGCFGLHYATVLFTKLFTRRSKRSVVQ